MHDHLATISKTAIPVGASTTTLAGLTEFLVRHGFNEVTVWCAIGGFVVSLAGLALQAWIHLPKIVESWRFVRGEKVK